MIFYYLVDSEEWNGISTVLAEILLNILVGQKIKIMF